MRYVLLACALILYYSASSQEVKYTPVQYGQFFNTFSIINPASTGVRNKWEITSGRQQHGGAWKNVSSTFAAASFRFNDSTARKFQGAGVSFIADHEGLYLKRSRVNFNYAYHVPLTTKLALAAGISGGFFSYTVKSSSASISGSATSPDATLGLWFYSDRFFVGVAANQILNSSVTPLEETTRLVPHYNFMGGYAIKVNRSLFLNPQFVARYCSGLPFDFDAALVGTINNIVNAGVNYRHHKSVVPMLGFENLPLRNGIIKVMFSYAVPAGRIADNIQTYEVVLAYSGNPFEKMKEK
jgi:type IX secretion system PorP/SprF family membrane protein